MITALTLMNLTPEQWKKHRKLFVRGLGGWKIQKPEEWDGVIRGTYPAPGMPGHKPGVTGWEQVKKGEKA